MENEQETGTGGLDRAGGEIPEESDQREPGPGEGEGSSSRLARISGRVPRVLLRKPALFAIAGLLLGSAGAWGLMNVPARKGAEASRTAHSMEPAAKDGLREEELGRFYIPMPEDGPHSVLVIDWSVVWDGLSAVRFRNAEVMIRNGIYDALTGLAARQEGLNEDLPALEETMSRRLKESLRSEGVSVRVKQVKTY
jgi:hypothetical protein